MDIVMCLLWVYFLLIWTPVDWVLGSELMQVRGLRRSWFRYIVLRTVRFRIVRRCDWSIVEGTALVGVPYRPVVLIGSKRGAFRSYSEAEHAIDCVKADIRVWLRGNDE